MILEGVDGKTSRHAVGHIPGTALPGQSGNVSLAGHRDTFFRGLRNIHKDDEITLTTLRGSYRYRVGSTQVVEPQAAEVLDLRTPDAARTGLKRYSAVYNFRASQAPLEV
jgi:sortase A